MIETAENGKQALEKLHLGDFDLVLLDIEMPEMNGYQTLEACMQDTSLARYADYHDLVAGRTR